MKKYQLNGSFSIIGGVGDTPPHTPGSYTPANIHSILCGSQVAHYYDVETVTFGVYLGFSHDLFLFTDIKSVFSLLEKEVWNKWQIHFAYLIGFFY